MSILDELGKKELWDEFAEYKLARGHISAAEAQKLREWIDAQGYRTVTDAIKQPGYCFAPPTKKEVNKSGSVKKRVVYSFSEDENLVLKLVAYCLARYDGVLAPNCCSFRRSTGAKQAIRRMTSLPGIDNMLCYKLDIKNYFNSIDVGRLLTILDDVLSDDKPLFDFISRLLGADCAVFEGELIREKRGAMAGTPISPFLANIYLAELDRHFEEIGVPYARYSDDIIVFNRDRASQFDSIAYIAKTLERYSLEINTDKVSMSLPGEPWTFLGVQYCSGSVCLSEATIGKLKAKIRRKARSIYRWKQRKGVDGEKAMRVFARVINKKLFDNPRDDELTWARWFFPLITSARGLKELDEYIQQNMRFVACGRFSKTNYKITYSDLKDCGYCSLVNMYYKYVDSEKSSS